MRSAFAAAALLVVTAACADQVTGPENVTADAKRSAEIVGSGVWAREITGSTGPGSQYAIFVPQDWNGDVVYYAHGIRPAADPVDLPTSDGIVPLRDALGAMGYAVAYSSFSENGWAVKDGAQRTHQLRGLFTAEVGRPERSYLMGHSMGGLIAQNLAERFPEQYDGTLAMCAPLAGAEREIAYLAHVRTIFDYFFPNVVPGTVIDVPEGTNRDLVLYQAQLAIMGNPTILGVMPRLQQTPIAGITGTELVTSILYAIGYNISGAEDFLDRTNGQSFFDNSATYAAVAPGALPEALLADINARVDRYTMGPVAEAFLEKYYDPTAVLSDPTITLHTTRDPLVPVFHSREFGANAASTGSSPLLVQREVTRFGHCVFGTAEMTDAFQALAGWVESGVRPQA